MNFFNYSNLGRSRLEEILCVPGVDEPELGYTPDWVFVYRGMDPVTTGALADVMLADRGTGYPGVYGQLYSNLSEEDIQAIGAHLGTGWLAVETEITPDPHNPLLEELGGRCVDAVMFMRSGASEHDHTPGRPTKAYALEVLQAAFAVKCPMDYIEWSLLPEAFSPEHNMSNT